MRKITDKILSITALQSKLNEDHKQGQTTVLTNGCFDLLHRGHTSYLQEARALGDKLVVAVNSDESVIRLKGEKRPIVPLCERMDMLACFEFVDYVCFFEEDTPCNVIEKLQPKIFVKGGDWKIEQLIERNIVKAYGGKVQILLEVGGKSTTNIIQTILKRYA